MNYTIDIVQQARIAVEQASVAVAKAQLDFLLESRVRIKPGAGRSRIGRISDGRSGWCWRY